MAAWTLLVGLCLGAHAVTGAFIRCMLQQLNCAYRLTLRLRLKGLYYPRGVDNDRPTDRTRNHVLINYLFDSMHRSPQNLSRTVA
jgi:hypothetical protein